MLHERGMKTAQLYGIDQPGRKGCTCSAGCPEVYHLPRIWWCRPAARRPVWAVAALAALAMAAAATVAVKQ